jgi:hypothetical protein
MATITTATTTSSTTMTTPSLVDVSVSKTCTIDVVFGLSLLQQQ